MMMVKTGVFWSTRGPEAHGRAGEVSEETQLHRSVTEMPR